MCGRCEGDPYRGVKSLFDGDLQAVMDFEDRADWEVISGDVAVYLGESDLKNEHRPLFHGCEIAAAGLTDSERISLLSLSKTLSRPAYSDL